jgi:hypothetical protein
VQLFWLGSVFCLLRSYGDCGIGQSTSWAYVGTAPGEASPSSGYTAGSSTWVHFRVIINKSGEYATWYANGILKQQVAITLQGSYLGISAYSISGNIANIRIYPA